jgi:two-component system, sensor histidine kinase and response regulator
VPETDPPVLDESVLDELLESTGDDRAFVEELVSTYLADAATQVADIRTAVESDDAAALVRPAHTLKSSSATVGAARLAAVARELEMAGRSGHLDGATRSSVERVQAEWRAATGQLEAWLTRGTRA